SFAAVWVDELVRGDAVEPRPEAGALGIEALEVAVGPLERRRRDGLGRLGGPGPPVGEGVDPARVPAVELGESAGIPTCASDQLAVGGLVEIEGEQLRRAHGSSSFWGRSNR